MPGIKQFSRMNYQVQRGLRELLSERYITLSEWDRVLAIFGQRCAFCGIEHSGNNRTGLVRDHLIPAVDFGELCLGNTVPACQDCNDRRGRRPWRDYLSNVFGRAANERIERIERYLDSYPYSPVSNPSHAFANEEHAEYVRLLEDWEALWQRARTLRDAVKRRRKARSSAGDRTVDASR